MIIEANASKTVTMQYYAEGARDYRILDFDVPSATRSSKDWNREGQTHEEKDSSSAALDLHCHESILSSI